MSQDVMICVMNSTAIFDDVDVEMQSSESCVKCLDLDSLSNNQNALKIPKYFKNNDLKAQLQAKDTTICKLKEHIKSMRENDKEEKVKHEMDEIETINIELEHSVAKLLSKNKRLHKEIMHFKKNYKDQFDSIKKTRALSKEHDDSLIAQLNSKSMENVDLKRQIQDNIFVITSLKNDLRKLKGKEAVENVAQIPIATTISPGMVTPKKVVHLKESTSNSGETQKPEIKVYSKRPKQVKSVVSSKKAKIVESKIANNSEPTHLWGSNAIDVPSYSSLVNDMLSRLSSGETQKPEIKVYSRRPKQVKSVVSSKKAKIVESKIANNSEPTHLWGSNAIDVPSYSSLVNDMLSPELSSWCYQS
ncbi:hypothetical protein Tco_1194905 [Tanacetum coccineum]